MATVIFLPDRAFDVTEVAVPWKLLTRPAIKSSSRRATSPAAGPAYLIARL